MPLRPVRPSVLSRSHDPDLKRARRPAVRAAVCALLLLAPDVAAAQQGTPAPAPASVAARAQAQARRDSTLIDLARRQLGRRYLFGGTSPESGFDCSGFVRYLMRTFGVETPRTAAQMARAGREVPRDVSQLRVGDILTFGTGRVSHVGIYIGNGRYIHASTGAGRIVEARLDRPASPLVKAWYGVRRMFESDSAAEAVAKR
jgi:cell wall-associated NlpC family hydrolase